MSTNQRKVIVVGSIVRAKLLGIPLDEALAITLEKFGAQVSEFERDGLRQDETIDVWMTQQEVKKEARADGCTFQNSLSDVSETIKTG